MSRRTAWYSGTAAALLALHATLAWLIRAASITTVHDDAAYLLLARGLRHFSYHSSWLVGAPLQTQYPPLYPGVLALTSAVFGEGVAQAVALNIVLSAAALGVSYALARRWSPLIALLALAAAAVNPWLVFLAGNVSSEPLFMLCIGLALWWSSAPDASRGTRAAAVTAAIAAALTRSIGVTMVAALLVQWLLERRFGTVFRFGVAGAVILGAWFLWILMGPPGLPGQSYLGDALYPGDVAASTRTVDSPAARPPAPGPPGTQAPAAAARPPAAAPASAPAAKAPLPPSRPSLFAILASRVGRNGRSYLSVGIHSALGLPTIKGTTADNWLWLIVVVILAAVGTVELSRRVPAAAVVLCCYTLVLLLWPYALERYLAPVVPLILLTLFWGARGLARYRPGLAGWALPVLLCGVLLISGLRLNLKAARVLAGCDRTAPLTSPGCFDPAQRAFFAAALAGDKAAPAGSSFLSPKSATLFYLTGRKSVDAFHAFSVPPDELRKYLAENGVQYILLSRVHANQQWQAKRLEPLCPEWELKAEYGGQALLLGRAGGATRDPRTITDSCAAIARFANGPW